MKLKFLIDLVKTKIKAVLASIKWVSSCANGWSDATMRCFNGYVCQGIDDNWKMNTINFAFQFVQGKYLKNYLFFEIKFTQLFDFILKKKIFGNVVNWLR